MYEVQSYNTGNAREYRTLSRHRDKSRAITAARRAAGHPQHKHPSYLSVRVVNPAADDDHWLVWPHQAEG